MSEDILLRDIQGKAPLGALDELPRAHFFRAPTPIEALSNLGLKLNRNNLYVKRDDLTGLVFGGNKVRQLEFYLGDAMEQGADTILITGAVQSNFVRMAAGAARKCGMECHIQLEERVPSNDPAYRQSGNVLIDRILGATIHSYPQGEDEAGADRALCEIADKLKQQGHKPYIIYLSSGHAPLGALGYVDAAREILTQCRQDDLKINEVILASGSGHTHAGLLFGLRALGSDVRVTGICVRRDAGRQRPRLIERCDEIAELIGTENKVTDDDIVVIDTYLAPGYGRASKMVLEAMQLIAETEALLTDPVYTAKAMAGFLQRIEETEPGDGLLLLHTGGLPALFGYERDLATTFPHVMP